MKGLGVLPLFYSGIVILAGASWAQPVAPPVPMANQAQALPAGVQQDWWSQVQATIQKEEYEITWQEETGLPAIKAAYQAPNRAQGFRTLFTDEGIRVVPRDPEKAKWEWGLALTAHPAAGSSQPADGKVGAQHAVPVFVEDNRIEFDRGWITEWYVNSAEGLGRGSRSRAPSWKLEAGSRKLGL